jgi:hypothetical protein
MSVNMSCEYGEGGAWQLVKDGDVDGARQWLTANLHIRPYCGARCPLAPAGTRATAPAPPERPNGRNSADRRPSGSSGCGSAVPCQTSPEKVAAIRAAWLRVAEAAAADVASGDADAREAGAEVLARLIHAVEREAVAEPLLAGIEEELSPPPLVLSGHAASLTPY